MSKQRKVLLYQHLKNDSKDLHNDQQKSSSVSKSL